MNSSYSAPNTKTFMEKKASDLQDFSLKFDLQPKQIKDFTNIVIRLRNKNLEVVNFFNMNRERNGK